MDTYGEYTMKTTIRMVVDKDEKRPRGRPRNRGWTISGDIIVIWHSRPNDGGQAVVFKYGGNCRHTLAYKSQCEKVKHIFRKCMSSISDPGGPMIRWQSVSA